MSIVGNQFHLVALPWVVLQLTGSASAVGLVTMAGSIPQGVLMLTGGAICDRIAPRNVLIVANLVRGVAATTLATLIASGQVQRWHLFALSIVFGTCAAFFDPAFSSIVPLVADRDDLGPPNGLLLGTKYFVGSGGPAVAGLLVAAGGAAWAFATDGASFFVAVALLLGMPASRAPVTDASNMNQRATWASIREGARYVWRDTATRTLVIINGAIYLCSAGPVVVGFSALASGPLRAGPAGLGGFYSVLAFGSLAGAVRAGLYARTQARGHALLTAAAGIAAGMILLGTGAPLGLAFLTVAAMGYGIGLTTVVVIIWLHERTDPRVLGRVVSVVLFSSIVVTPVSLGLASRLVLSGVTTLFVVAGIALAAATAAAQFLGGARRIDAITTAAAIGG